MSKHVKFASKTGGQIDAVLAEPPGSAKAGGLVVVHEWWGLTDHIQSLCDRFAQAGFLAIAPDLFHGKRPATQEEAAKTMGALDRKNAVAEIGDAVAFLRGHAGGNGRCQAVYGRG